MPKYAPNTTDFDLIIIDEAQRMYPYQFDKYIEEVRTSIKNAYSHTMKTNTCVIMRKITIPKKGLKRIIMYPL